MKNIMVVFAAAILAACSSNSPTPSKEARDRISPPALEPPTRESSEPAPAEGLPAAALSPEDDEDLLHELTEHLDVTRSQDGAYVLGVTVKIFALEKRVDLHFNSTQLGSPLSAAELVAARSALHCEIMESEGFFCGEVTKREADSVYRGLTVQALYDDYLFATWKKVGAAIAEQEDRKKVLSAHFRDPTL